MAPIATSELSDVSRLAALTADFDDNLTFYLNGTRVVLEDVDPEITLLDYLRGIGLTGTKLQCGFCTPGIVMSLYALLRNHPDPSQHDIEEAFDGNLCRCTGYRPILDAAQSFTATSSPCGKATANGGSGCCMEQPGGGGCCKGKDLPDQGPLKTFTRPDFIKYDRDTELIFPPHLKKYQMKPLAFGNKRKRWCRPVTIDELLQIKSAYPAAKIIGGSTETQIEIKFKALQYPVSIYVGDIPELRQYRFNDDHLEIGGNIALTDLEEISLEAVKHYGKAKAQVFEAINKQLKFFAGRQIRNVGTPAGNLVTASPISDLNPVLRAANATDLSSPDAIIASIRIPLNQEQGEFFRAYKQAKRKDDDIAIVTAALRVRLDEDGIVEDCDLIYGGMAAMTVAAKSAQEYLVGRKLAELETLEGTMSALESDFNLPFGVPGGMASYRKALAMGFFYRFYHDILGELEAKVKGGVDTEVVEELEREISFGAVDELTAADYEQEVVGKKNPHLAALKQTTGEAQYTDDIPPSETSSLDIPGVIDYVDKDDLPNARANRWGAPNFDEVFFAEEYVYTAGQPIAMVLATTPQKAQEAARAVKVEYEELPAILSIEEAIEKNSLYDYERYIKKGNAEEALKKCDYTFSGTARMGGQEHFYLETQACLVIPKPEDGELEVFSSTQNANETQVFVSQVCGVQCNKVVVRIKRLGGGFGGKETRSVPLSATVALAAKKTKRPVRCMLSREEDMVTSGQRHPFYARWTVGVNKDYKIQALVTDIYNNAGWSSDLSMAVCERAMTHSDGCYLIPNVHVRGHLCRTNTMSNTAFRGFGGPQGMFIAETYMEEIADRLGIPVEKFRAINFYQRDDVTHFNQTIKDWHVPLMYQQVLDESQYEKRRLAVTDFNKKAKWRKRGLALIPTKFGISFTALFLNQAGALVHIYHDGSILVAHGGIEMGQGLHTKMTQIAAQALEVPLDTVFISETATNTVANASSTAASASSDLNGYAIFNACEQLNERLAPYRKKLGPGATMKELAHAAYFDRVNLSAQGFYKTPEIGYVWGENKGKMFFYFTQGVTAAEVEIDTLTGRRPLHDGGVALAARGPMAGNLFTRGPGTYKIPGFRDIPQEFNVSLLKGVEWEELRTIQRSRGVGEPPLFMGSAVFFAIRDALKAARAQYGVVPATVRDAGWANQTDGEGRGVIRIEEGDGLLKLRSPATPERIRLACEDPIMRRTRVTPKDGEQAFFVEI
ncbi:unnamed protein product [Parascedosporium putredinis]|uniref:xanthine dehydrogenase n=1 Tax=Parascedosporium putredinis TaxID=1442378 RepID=A0A9P1MBU9_9PEZI|nr:unnamed protein product [Parascedosporium putredinis]CAI7999406.1 unnamed protein product [Parascedosporium putredinis]